jgi:tRNA1(Val) A37 N6-methylase TrmN6
VAVIYPAWRLDQIKKVLRETGFKPSRMLWIHPRKGASPTLICIEARLDEGWQGLIEDALFLYDGPQQRSRLALAIMEGEEIAAR